MCKEEMKQKIVEYLDSIDENTLEQLYWFLLPEI